MKGQNWPLSCTENITIFSEYCNMAIFPNDAIYCIRDISRYKTLILGFYAQKSSHKPRHREPNENILGNLLEICWAREMRKVSALWKSISIVFPCLIELHISEKKGTQMSQQFRKSESAKTSASHGPRPQQISLPSHQDRFQRCMFAQECSCGQ